jgi:hypothetical protein
MNRETEDYSQAFFRNKIPDKDSKTEKRIPVLCQLYERDRDAK